MKRSTDRFLTTHTGSLPRPDDLIKTMLKLNPPPQIDGVLAANDAMALGALEAFKDAKKKEADIRKLADQIVDLEKDARTSDFGGGTVKKLYQDWLSDEPLIRKHYEAAKGKALLSSTESAGGQ